MGLELAQQLARRGHFHRECPDVGLLLLPMRACGVDVVFPALMEARDPF